MYNEASYDAAVPVEDNFSIDDNGFELPPEGLNQAKYVRCMRGKASFVDRKTGELKDQLFHYFDIEGTEVQAHSGLTLTNNPYLRTLIAGFRGIQEDEVGADIEAHPFRPAEYYGRWYIVTIIHQESQRGNMYAKITALKPRLSDEADALFQ